MRLRATDGDGARGNESYGARWNESESENESERERERETESGREWEWRLWHVLKVFWVRSAGHMEGRKEIESNGLNFYV